MKSLLAVLAKSATGIAIASTLFLTQSCSSQIKSKETATGESIPASPVADSNSHAGHNMGDSEMSGMNHHDMHGGAAPTTTIAKLSIPARITPKTPVPLVIDVQEKDGKAINKFDTFQDKLMHLIIVSDDLQSFNHVHSAQQKNGRFQVEADFPHPGNYTLFSDYKPSGEAEQVSVLTTQVPGETPATPKIDLTRTQTFGDTKASLSFSQPTIKAGQEVVAMFDLKQASNNQPIADLQPYLGELGHLVIVKQSSPLTRADYIHAHASKDTPPGQIHFMTYFPKPGRYKMWGQFNRNGKVVTTNFWVDVQ